jgi:hypothetical protein
MFNYLPIGNEVNNLNNFSNADSPLELSNGQTWFVKPYEAILPFQQVIEKIRKQELISEKPGTSNVPEIFLGQVDCP